MRNKAREQRETSVDREAAFGLYGAMSCLGCLTLPWHSHPRMTLPRRERVWMPRCHSVLRFTRHVWRVKME